MKDQSAADPVRGFAAAARRFCAWAEAEKTGACNEMAEGLGAIALLVSRVIELLPIEVGDFDSVDLSAELDSVGERNRGLPLQYYGQVFNPLTVPPEEPAIGDLHDDVGDIYQHVKLGLLLHDRGQGAAALWEWSFGFRSHWGEHASSAMRAMAWWIAEARR